MLSYYKIFIHTIRFTHNPRIYCAFYCVLALRKSRFDPLYTHIWPGRPPCNRYMPPLPRVKQYRSRRSSRVFRINLFANTRRIIAVHKWNILHIWKIGMKFMCCAGTLYVECLSIASKIVWYSQWWNKIYRPQHRMHHRRWQKGDRVYASDEKQNLLRLHCASISTRGYINFDKLLTRNINFRWRQIVELG